MATPAASATRAAGRTSRARLNIAATAIGTSYAGSSMNGCSNHISTSANTAPSPAPVRS